MFHKKLIWKGAKIPNGHRKLKSTIDAFHDTQENS